MRKCVSMVAVATAAVGLAGCSAPDQAREPAGSAQPLSTAAAAGPLGVAKNVAPLAGVPHAATPGAPAGTGAQPQQPNPAADGANQLGAHRAPDAGLDPVGAPGSVPAHIDGGLPAVPIGTTSLTRPSSHAGPAPAPAKGVAPAKAAVVPPPALPAPPPPNADHLPDHRAQAPDVGYDAQAAAVVQIMDAMAAARSDGKAVLLDFGANWCTACRALDKAMRSPKAQAVLARSYHLVQVDLGTGDADHMRIASNYDAYGTFGMPLLIVLGPDGSVRVDSARSGQPKYDEAGLTAWLKQWAPR